MTTTLQKQPELEKNKLIYADKLEKHLATLPYHVHKDVTARLAKYCEVSTAVVYNWRAGRTFIKKGYRNLIIEFFDKDIFDI